MAKSLDKIIKGGKLTGEEVGRLMIKDMAETVRRQQAGITDGSGLLNYAQREALVNGLQTNADIRKYREHRELLELILKTATARELYFYATQSAGHQFLHVAESIRQADRERDQKKKAPLLMTAKQYEDLKAEARAAKLAEKITPESLILEAVCFYVERYKEKEKTPLDKYFKKAEKELLENPRIKANYFEEESGYYMLADGRNSRDMSSEEWTAALEEYREKDLNARATWIEDPSGRAAPEGTTKWDVLEYAHGFYHSEETGSRETFAEFIADYPDLYAALIADLAAMKGLDFISEIKPEDYHKSTIPMKGLYKNKILNYPEYVDTWEEAKKNGAAVFMEEYLPAERLIDERGHYEPEKLSDSGLEEEFRRLADTLGSIIDAFKGSAAEFYALGKGLELIAELVDIPEVKTMADLEGQKEERLRLLSLLIRSYIDTIQYAHFTLKSENPSLDIELPPQLSNQVYMGELRPKEEAIQKLRKAISFEYLEELGLGFAEALRVNVAETYKTPSSTGEEE